MILLAIETATLEVGAAIVGDDGPLAVVRTRPGRHHVESLHPAVASVLADAGVAPTDLDAIAVDVGPGLFTGLRVGIAAAKAFGLALDLPVVAVTSIEALGEVAQTLGSATMVPVVDMRRGEVAWQLPGGVIEIGPPEKLALALGALPRDALLVGDGALRWRDVFLAESSTEGRLRFGDDSLAAPSVLGVGAIGHRRAVDGRMTDAVSIEALYLRDADAKANYATRDPSTPGVR